MKNVYSIYDRVSAQYLNPEVHENDGVAIRCFLISCANPSIPDVYLDDITLCCIGSFDESSGTISPCPPKNIFFGNSPAVKDLRQQYKEVTENEISEKE